MTLLYRQTSRGLCLAVLFSLSSLCLAEYVELKPDFVVNLASDSQIKFVQVSAQIRVDTSEAAAALETHSPAIRHALVMLISSKTEKDVSSRDGKQQLREEAVQAIRTVLEEQHVTFTPPEVEEEKNEEGKTKETDNSNYTPVQDVFFTRFIIQ